MNERIQQLAEQAGLFVELNDNPWPKRLSADECVTAYNKFAELIVQECANIADEPTSRPFDSYGKKIKKHFGVEE